MEWAKIIVNILTLAAAITPLVIELVKYVRMAIKEKNWNNLLTLVMNLMQEAENKFEYGSEKKEWVMSMLKASSATINYDIDFEQVSALIDDMCSLSKKINAPESEN